MRGLFQGSGAKVRGLNRRTGPRLARCGSLLSLLGVIAAGCATQDENDLMPGGGTSSTGGASAGGTSGSASGGSSSAGNNSVAGSVAKGGTASGGSAGSGGTPAASGTGGGGAGGGGAGGTAAGGGAGGSAAGAGGKGGAGGTAGTAGKGGNGGTAGAGGGGGTSGSAGTGGSGGGTSCTVVTDCAAQQVCEASKCRARGCNATNCAYDLTRFIVGTPVAASARGQVFVTWSATKLNLDFHIFDKTAQNDSADNWQDDSVEIYLDLNHAQTMTYDADDFQINVPRDAGTTVGIPPGLDYSTVTVTRTENANGYRLEVGVPWSTLNGAGSQVGKTIGFDVAVNDDRDGGGRETQIMLFGTDQNYLNASKFGDLVLDP